MPDTAPTRPGALPAHRTGMLIDAVMPRYDATRAEHLVVAAEAPRAWQAVLATDFLQVPAQHGAPRAARLGLPP